MVIEEQGLSFVAEAGQRHLVEGLRIEVQEVFGRQGLVAYNGHFEPGGC